MAVSTIKAVQDTGWVTLDANSKYRVRNGICTSSDTPTTTALWTIPSEYRPKDAVTYPVVVYNSAGAPIVFRGSINTNGTVTQLATGTCRQAFGVATYKI